ncbi:hypothetical protein LLH23_05895 [bacterium]|nr:hypothetical protein [bacterium]
MDFHDTNTWGLIVGLVGLGVTIAGLCFAISAARAAKDAKIKATDAETAAQEATRAANRRSALEDLALVDRWGDELLRSLEASEWDRALEHARQTLRFVTEIEAQYSQIGLVDEAHLAIVAELLDSVCDECLALKETAGKNSRARTGKVHRAARQAMQHLAGQVGNLKKRPVTIGD